MKRIIRPEEDDSPRTQCDALRSSDNVCGSDNFRSDEAHSFGAALSEFAPQQNLDENARVMEGVMGDIRLHSGPRRRQLKSGSVVTDVSTLALHDQVERILEMARGCKSGGRNLSSAHVNAYARLNVAQPAKAFPLGSFFTGYSANEGQVYFEVPITCGYDIGDCRPDETIVIKGKLYRGPGSYLWIQLQNVGQQDADLVNAAVRRVIKRMEASMEPDQRICYQLPKFQVCFTYKLPGCLTRDDVAALQSACATTPQLMQLQREVQTKPKAPQLLMLSGESWKAQVNRGYIIVHEWLPAQQPACSMPRHLPAVDALLHFTALRAGAKRAHVQHAAAAADVHYDDDGSAEWMTDDCGLQHRPADSGGAAACPFLLPAEDAFFSFDAEGLDGDAWISLDFVPSFLSGHLPGCSPRSPVGA